MQGRIDKAEYNDKGKLRLQVGGQWYTAKPPELAQMVGQTITFEPQPWTIPNTNKVINFINNYGVTDASTTPAGQAFDQAHAQSQPTADPYGFGSNPPPMGNPVPPSIHDKGAFPPQAPQRPPVDRDASITALALVKCIQGIQSTETAFTAYKDLYNKVLEWNPGEFDSDIPY